MVAVKEVIEKKVREQELERLGELKGVEVFIHENKSYILFENGCLYYDGEVMREIERPLSKHLKEIAKREIRKLPLKEETIDRIALEMGLKGFAIHKKVVFFFHDGKVKVIPKTEQGIRFVYWNGEHLTKSAKRELAELLA